MPGSRRYCAAKPLRPCPSIGPKSAGIATVLQLSDLHLLGDTPLNGDPGRGSFLPDLLRALEAQDAKFDLVLVTGDLIDASELNPWKWRKAMANARKALMSICRAVRVKPREGLLVIPGNHDVRWRGVYTLPSPTIPRLPFIPPIPCLPSLSSCFERHFGRFFVHSYYPKLGLLVACFDSNLPTRWFDSAKGTAPVTQCEEVLKDLKGLTPRYADAEAAFRLALIHHHLLPIPANDHTAAAKGLVGAPSQMLLRNAASFLQRLLAHDYRLVLHGHLHSHGYWLPQTFLDRDPSPRWLELISCDWAGASLGGDRTFNVVKIHRGGPVEVDRVVFRDDGQAPRTIPQPMADQHLIRTRAWDRRARGGGAVRCRLDSQRWDVLLPSGDVVISRFFKGLRGDGEAADQMEVTVAAAALANVQFEVKGVYGGAVGVSWESFVRRGEAPGDAAVVFRLRFSPALGPEESDAIDVLLHIIIFGACATSLEDQGHAGLSQDGRQGKEAIHYEAVRACGRAVLNLRFLARSGTEAPKGLALQVYAPHSTPTRHESDSDHLFWDYWSAAREPTSGLGIQSTPGAVLGVYRPQIGYGYALEWDLPRREPWRDAPALDYQRELLLRLDAARPFTAVALFLQEIETYLKTRRPCAPCWTVWDDDTLGVYLFAFDAADHMLKRVGIKFHEGDDFPSEVAYGRDLIGTVFRQRHPLGAYFNREYSGDDWLFERIPHDVQCLGAWPLWRVERTGPPERPESEPLDLAPVGVLALASRRRQSGLSYHIQTDNRDMRLRRKIISRWEACQIDAGWARPSRDRLATPK